MCLVDKKLQMFPPMLGGSQMGSGSTASTASCLLMTPPSMQSVHRATAPCGTSLGGSITCTSSSSNVGPTSAGGSSSSSSSSNSLLITPPTNLNKPTNANTGESRSLPSNANPCLTLCRSWSKPLDGIPSSIPKCDYYCINVKHASLDLSFRLTETRITYWQNCKGFMCAHSKWAYCMPRTLSYKRSRQHHTGSIEISAFPKGELTPNWKKCNLQHLPISNRRVVWNHQKCRSIAPGRGPNLYDGISPIMMVCGWFGDCGYHGRKIDFLPEEPFHCILIRSFMTDRRSYGINVIVGIHQTMRLRSFIRSTTTIEIDYFL